MGVVTPNMLTRRYLAEAAERGDRAARLVQLAREQFDLAATSYDGDCLTRPVFLEHAEFSVLRDDLLALHAALASLSVRLFGGDVAAFARAVGMTGAQVTAIERAGGQPPTSLGRADLFQDETAFRVLELNLGSALGGLDNALLNRAFLADPMVADFVASHGLSYVDTMDVLVDTLRAECGLPDGARPLIAVADWPESFPVLERQLRYSAAQLARYGLEAVPCHLGQLRATDRPGLAGRQAGRRDLPGLPDQGPAPARRPVSLPTRAAGRRTRRGRALRPDGRGTVRQQGRARRCCRTRPTGTCSAARSWRAWTGSCRGRGWSAPGRSRSAAAGRPTWPSTPSPNGSTWCSSRPRCTRVPG